VSKACAAALVAAFVAFAPVARAADATILILGGGLAAEEERLVEALRIYTGDVDGRLVLAGKAPGALEPSVITELTRAARREGADVVVWGGRRADGRPIFYVLDVAARDLRETEIEPLGAERAAVDVALKVRALLFSHRAGQGKGEGAAQLDAKVEGAHDAAPPPGLAAPTPSGPAAAAPTPPAPPLAEPRPAAPVVAEPAAPAAAPVVVVRAAPVERPVSHRLGFTAGYELVLPTDRTWLRNGALLSAELRLGRGARGSLSIFVDGALETRPSGQVRGFDVTVSDVPIGVGLLVTRASPTVSVAAGPRASLHAFDVRASDDGRAGTSRRYAAGLGGAVRLDLRLATYMKICLGASIEGLVPKQEFTIAGQPAVDTGSMLTGVWGGFEWLLL
jgi:hypothetical protein